jgi:hypothetical protein
MNRSGSVKNELYTKSEVLDSSSTSKLSPSISVFNSKIGQNISFLHKESLKFLSFLTMTNILVQVSYNCQELSDMWITCRKIYQDDAIQLDRIDELEKTYESSQALKYYTKSPALFRAVNQACGTENMQQIFNFRVFISDLNNNLREIDKQQQEGGMKSSIKYVYRGKRLSGSVLQKLIDHEGGLISMNSFLSTTLDVDVALAYACPDTNKNENSPVLFRFRIDTNIKQPYACISNYSQVAVESEVLFSLGTIWRIETVSMIEKLWEIHLISCDELDLQINELLKNYTENGCNLSSLGDILNIRKC